MPLTHEDSYGYPTLAQAAPQAQLLLQLVTGGADPGLTISDKVKSAHTVLSFALSLGFPHDHAATADQQAAFQALSDYAVKAHGSTEGALAIDWKAIAKLALAFLLSLLG